MKQGACALRTALLQCELNSTVVICTTLFFEKFVGALLCHLREKNTTLIVLDPLQVHRKRTC